MTQVAIPAWTPDGFLPPRNESQPVGRNRSPYVCSVTDCLLRFGTSAARRTILGGLLEYRTVLRAVGFISGFQWIDGSFLENVETAEGRPPNDIDVVTFYRLPAGRSQREALASAPQLADTKQMKRSYHVDGYMVDLATKPELLVRHAAYWYSVWSHRRNRVWKGYIELELGTVEETNAVATLASLSDEGSDA